MTGSQSTLDRIAGAVGYGLLGAVGTALAALVLLRITGPLQGGVYRAAYLHVGPWSAYETAVVAQFGLALSLAVAVSVLSATATTERSASVRPTGLAVAGVSAVFVASLLAAVFLASEPIVAALALALATAGAPVVLFLRGVRTRGVAAFAGAVPAVFVGLLLLAVGLGWGGGYDLVAEPIDPGTADGTAVADFDGVPELRDDLFAADACDDAGGTCRLALRGYEHEVATARFLDRHGVRCPFTGGADPAGWSANRSFVAEHGGERYRVNCVAYGD